MTYTPVVGCQVVGIIGKSRAGKDTLARSLLRALPGAERYAFSDAIATHARLMGAMDRRDPAVLQRVGWNMRAVRPNIWRDTLYWSIVDKAPDYAIVTGARFQDEVDMLRAMGGVIVRVVRTEPGGAEMVATDRDPDHPVERQIDTLKAEREVNIGSGHLHMFAHAADWLAEWLRSREPSAHACAS